MRRILPAVVLLAVAQTASPAPPLPPSPSPGGTLPSETGQGTFTPLPPDQFFSKVGADISPTGMTSWGIGVFQSYQEFAAANKALTDSDEGCIDLSSLGAPEVPSSCASQDDQEDEPGSGDHAGSGGPQNPGDHGSHDHSGGHGGTSGGGGGGGGDDTGGGGGGGGGGTGGGGGGEGSPGSGFGSPPDAKVSWKLQVPTSRLGASLLSSQAGTMSCGQCYQKAQHKINSMRLNLERLHCTYKELARYVKASISFGDSMSGIHAMMGAVWQKERAEIQKAFEHSQSIYDKKLAEMLPNLKGALDSLAQCEAEFFHDNDWYERFGFIYYTFMSDRYKRTD